MKTNLTQKIKENGNAVAVYRHELLDVVNQADTILNSTAGMDLIAKVLLAKATALNTLFEIENHCHVAKIKL